MNRRSFLLKSAMAAFGFSILPGAGRIWKPRRWRFIQYRCGGIDPSFLRYEPMDCWVLNPEWEKATYRILFSIHNPVWIPGESDPYAKPQVKPYVELLLNPAINPNHI